MKKIIFFALVAAAALCASSCKDSDKCICTIDTAKTTYKDRVMKRAEGKKCSEMTTAEIDLGLFKLDASESATISCKNYNE